MHALSVIYVLRSVEGIAEFRFVQHKVDAVEVLVVPGPGWSEVSRSQVMAGLAARLGNDVRVDVRRVDAIPAEASGKHRYVVSHVPVPQALALEASVA
jgi:phenylacetate-CoA ligase